MAQPKKTNFTQIKKIPEHSNPGKPQSHTTGNTQDWRNKLDQVKDKISKNPNKSAKILSEWLHPKKNKKAA